MAETEYVSRRALWLNRLSDEVVRGISDRIRAGDLVRGAPLPSRRALMSEYVTSDGVVENAIGKLIAAGIVTRSTDGELRISGVPTSGDAFAIPDCARSAHADVVAILELRIGVEAESARLAAARRTDAGLTAIAAAAEDFAAAVQRGSGVAQADYRFHLAIADASGNRYIHELTDYLGPLLIPRMRIDFPADREREADLRQAVQEHGAIVEAISAGDAEAAAAAMRSHIARSLESVRRIA